MALVAWKQENPRERMRFLLRQSRNNRIFIFILLNVSTGGGTIRCTETMATFFYAVRIIVYIWLGAKIRSVACLAA